MWLGYHSITWGGVAGDATEVTSVKDLLYRVPGDMHRALLAETRLSLVNVYTRANFVYPEILPDELNRARRAAGAARLEALDTMVGIGEEHGLSACYHPHLTTILESPAEVEKIFARSRIGFCPATTHLAAGGDPAALIRRYPDRIRHVHLKDLHAATTTFLLLGQGEVDFTDVLAAMCEVDYDGWLIIELDSYDGDPAEAARISRAFLDKVLS